MHIKLSGRFTASVAMDLAALMKNSHHGEGAIYVYMGRVTEIETEGVRMMHRLMGVAGLPKGRIVFTGEKGLLLMEGGSHYAAMIVSTRLGCVCPGPWAVH